MRKLILSIFFPLLFTVVCQAQKHSDLEFEFRFNKDTVTIGEDADLIGFVANNGPDSFSGYIKFNVRPYTLSQNPDANNLEDSDAKFSLDSIFFNIGASRHSIFVLPIRITKDFWADSTNIVIVWPSETFTDEQKANNYGLFKVFVEKGSGLGIEPQHSGISLFNVYPNPAKNEVKISFESVRKGKIMLTDITGKTLITEDITAGSQSIFMPLAICGKTLPEGIYFVSLQTENGIVTKKLQVTR